MNKKYVIKFEDEQNKLHELCFTYEIWQKIVKSLKENFTEIDNNGFYNSIVENLKKEAKHLNDKLQKYRDNHDMNGYISTLKSLRETLGLIEKYDWQLMYSEYEIINEFNSKQKQVSI